MSNNYVSGAEAFCSSHSSISLLCSTANQQACGCATGMMPTTPVCSTSCTPCPAGSLCSGVLAPATACTCSVGYSSTSMGQSACATTVAPCNQCAQGTYCLGNGAQPAPCVIGSVPAGRYCPAGTTTASGTTCPAGSSCAGAAANAGTS